MPHNYKEVAQMVTFTQHASGTDVGRYYWVSLRLGGDTVARTETYTSTSSCDNAVSAVRRGRLNYEVFKATDGWRFRMVGRNGEIVFQGTDPYATNASAKSVAARVRADAPSGRYIKAPAA